MANKAKTSVLHRKASKTQRTKPNLNSTEFSLKSILVPTDFSDESYEALDYAVALAEVFSARITLAHIVVPITTPDAAYGTVAWNESTAQENAKQALEKIRQNRAATTDIQVDQVVRTGHPYLELDRIAKNAAADLIVISTHGRTGLKHFLLGSVAEHVVRYAPCPVLVVREKERHLISTPKKRNKR